MGIFANKKNKKQLSTQRSSLKKIIPMNQRVMTNQIKNQNIHNIQSPKKIHIKQFSISSANDFLLLRRELIEGNIMVVNLKSLIQTATGIQQNREPLQKQLQLIKQYCTQHGGSASKIQDDLIVITPNSNIRFQ